MNTLFKKGTFKKIDNNFLIEGTEVLSQVTKIQTFCKQKTDRKTYRRFGGERGIRTLARCYTSTPLAGEPLEPLGYFSKILSLTAFDDYFASLTSFSVDVNNFCCFIVEI